MADQKRKIAIIGGDGIGPEVTREAKLVLEKLRDREGLPLELWELDLGADRYLRDGTTFPKEIAEEIEKTCSAVLLGALGDPRVPGLEARARHPFRHALRLRPLRQRAAHQGAR